MDKNPFQKGRGDEELESVLDTPPADPVEEAVESAEAGEELFGEESETVVVEEGEGADDVDLFTEPADTEAEADTAEAVKAAPDIPRVPKKRLDKVIAQRQTARAEAKELAAANEKLAADLAAAEERAGDFGDYYSDFEDPGKQAAWDIELLKALETKSAADPAFAKSIQTVIDAMTGEKPVTEAKKTPAAEQKAPAADAAVTKLLRRQARTEVVEQLTALKPGIQKIVADHIVNAEGFDLENVDPIGVKTAFQEWFATSGFEKADILAAAPDKGKPKPNAAGKGGNAGVSNAKDAEDTPEQKKAKEAPKTLEEYREKRDKRWEAVGAEVFGS